jgi:hypothetical protein
MNEKDYIIQSLYHQMLPVYEAEIPFIYELLQELREAGKVLNEFPDLNMETPITIVDRDLMV